MQPEGSTGNQLCDLLPSAGPHLTQREARASAADQLVAHNTYFCLVRQTGGKGQGSGLMPNPGFSSLPAR